MSRPVVVKVGGSLFLLPDLGQRLRAFLDPIEAPVLLFPGGGPSADLIRELDRVHRLGEEASHWLALRACTLNGHFLARLLPGFVVTAEVPSGVPRAIVDAYAFALADEVNADRLPHCWEVTSDSMAVRVAQRAGAAVLILLKSVSSGADVVDPFFAAALARAGPLDLRVVNLRSPPGEPGA